jgi:hypothetical protein
MVSRLPYPYNTGETQPRRMPTYSPRRYSVGVDLGQANDPTAIAVLERTVVPPQTALFAPVGKEPSNRLVEGDIVYDLVYLKRPKLGKPYDVIAKRVADLICELEPEGAFGELGQVTLSVDGTGVGRGVVDMLDTEFKRRAATLSAVPRVDFRRVSVTGSQTQLKRPERTNGYWSVPKKDLVFPAVAAFQQGKIRIGKVKDRDALVNELKNYKRTTNIATGGCNSSRGVRAIMTTSSSRRVSLYGAGKCKNGGRHVLGSFSRSKFA